MDSLTGLILLLMVVTALTMFLASIPMFITIAYVLHHHQKQMSAIFQQNQQWTINTIATMSDHHSQNMQHVMMNLFHEMKRLSGKIPTVSPSPKKQPTGSLKKLPDPVPILVTPEHDEGKRMDTSSFLND